MNSLTLKTYLRYKNHLPNCSREQDMATFVFWKPCQPCWIFPTTNYSVNKISIPLDSLSLKTYPYTPKSFPSCSRKQDMTTFVFWQPSWWPSWIFQKHSRVHVYEGYPAFSGWGYAWEKIDTKEKIIYSYLTTTLTPKMEIFYQTIYYYCP